MAIGKKARARIAPPAYTARSAKRRPTSTPRAITSATGNTANVPTINLNDPSDAHVSGATVASRAHHDRATIPTATVAASASPTNTANGSGGNGW